MENTASFRRLGKGSAPKCYLNAGRGTAWFSSTKSSKPLSSLKKLNPGTGVDSANTGLISIKMTSIAEKTLIRFIQFPP